jgi:hypothetical protein
MTVAYIPLARPPRSDASDDVYYEDGPRHTIDVLQAIDAPHDTGLVTADGVPIYRVTQRGPVGFGR